MPPELSRDLARTAREVLAWGSELRDSCAVAAAQEALYVLKPSRPAVDARPVRAASSGWRKKGVVVCLHVGHSPGTDSNQLAARIKQKTLSLVLDRPQFPLHVCVATLSVDDHALSGWLRRYPETLDPVSTLTPLLVSALFPAGAASCDDVVAYLTAATSLDGYADVLPPSARAYRAILPVAAGLLTPIQKRCMGGAICGRCRP
ncbi:MAG: hypothetical protein WD602_00685 [Actinomycetota bacterium]